jgi:hypothetical protein
MPSNISFAVKIVIVKYVGAYDGNLILTIFAVAVYSGDQVCLLA